LLPLQVTSHRHLSIRFFFPTLLLLLLSACEVSDPTDAIVFAAPVAYHVRAGDTLTSISQSEGVDLTDLMLWNGLTDDRIAVDDTLILWPDTAKAVPPTPASPPARTVAAPKRPPPRARAKPRAPKRPVVILKPLVIDAPQRVIVADGARSVKTAGILSALAETQVLGDGLDAKLSDRVEQLQARRSHQRSTALGSRDLGDVGRAETVSMVRTTPRTSGPQVPDRPVSAPSLPRPRPKRCLAGPDPSQLTSDHGHLVAQGLTASQIRSAMGGIIQTSMACIPRGTTGSFTFETEITVGCNGTVSRVSILRNGGLPGTVAQCISRTLTHASFPAHALPDGMTFQYPIQYRY
jgi:hypothetical protein